MKVTNNGYTQECFKSHKAKICQSGKCRHRKITVRSPCEKTTGIFSRTVSGIKSGVKKIWDLRKSRFVQITVAAVVGLGVIALMVAGALFVYRKHKEDRIAKVALDEDVIVTPTPNVSEIKIEEPKPTELILPIPEEVNEQHKLIQNDEDFARDLQKEFDLEDSNLKKMEEIQVMQIQEDYIRQLEQKLDDEKRAQEEADFLIAKNLEEQPSMGSFLIEEVITNEAPTLREIVQKSRLKRISQCKIVNPQDRVVV